MPPEDPAAFAVLSGMRFPMLEGLMLPSAWLLGGPGRDTCLRELPRLRRLTFGFTMPDCGSIAGDRERRVAVCGGGAGRVAAVGAVGDSVCQFAVAGRRLMGPCPAREWGYAMRVPPLLAGPKGSTRLSFTSTTLISQSAESCVPSDSMVPVTFKSPK